MPNHSSITRAAIACVVRGFATTRTRRQRMCAVPRRSIRSSFLPSARVWVRQRQIRSSSSGLPRAGSTLLEQILSSHPSVEGTMELPDIPSIAGTLGAQEKPLPDIEIPRDRCESRALTNCVRSGEQYLQQTRIQRKTDAPFFIDKMPNNFAHVGLIHLILPNAKIIDARRHPLGCCFSGFKQHFARGQHFTYSLEDIGRYYRDYVELMAHFDTVLPGSRASGHLRTHDRRHGGRSAAVARLLRAALR